MCGRCYPGSERGRNLAGAENDGRDRWNREQGATARKGEQRQTDRCCCEGGGDQVAEGDWQRHLFVPTTRTREVEYGHSVVPRWRLF
jgi:hypothetical protein